MNDTQFPEARILIVDDEEPNLRLLDLVLRQAGYQHIRCLADPRETFAVYDSFQPDLLLLDLSMPYLSGFQVLERLRQSIPRGDYFPVLVLTADTTFEAKQHALTAGANDFLNKPFNTVEVLLRIRNLLETRSLHQQLQKQNEILEIRVRERTHDLEEARTEILERLSAAAEFRDDDTGEHTQRVGEATGLLAEAMSLPAAEVELLRRAAPLHDLGKVGIPDYLLLKPSRLTPAEFEVMKQHTTIGGEILAGSRSALLQLAEQIARTHHERWDGNGYPAGLREETIPLPGRIVAVADAFDALTHERPYKKAWPVDEAVAEIHRLSGAHFDPRVVEAFGRLIAAGALPLDMAAQPVG